MELMFQVASGCFLHLANGLNHLGVLDGTGAENPTAPDMITLCFPKADELETIPSQK